MPNETVPVAVVEMLHALPEKLSLKRTADALIHRNREKRLISIAFDRARDDNAVKIAEMADLCSIMQVQIAFYKDTADRNCVENCLACPITVLEKMVAKWKVEG